MIIGIARPSCPVPQQLQTCTLGHVDATKSLTVDCSARVAKSSTTMTFSRAGREAQVLTASIGANLVTGIQISRAFSRNSLACARVFERLSGRPSVITKTMDWASARPFDSSLEAAAKAPEVKVVDCGHVRAWIAFEISAESVEKWLTHDKPQVVAMSGGVCPAVRAPVHAWKSLQYLGPPKSSTATWAPWSASL